MFTFCLARDIFCVLDGIWIPFCLALVMALRQGRWIKPFCRRSPMRHTKILATVGPAVESEPQLEKLMEAGVDAFRLNFSHGSHEWHEAICHRIRRLARKAGRSVAVLQDLQGPKIRLGMLRNDHVELISGSSLALTTCPIEGTAERIPTSYADLPRELAPGDRILIDEGRIRLMVEAVQGTEIYCQVVVGGSVSSRKGIHLPGIKTSLPSLTEKDRADLAFGLSLGVDYVALSFVRSAEDVLQLRHELKQKGGSIPIISKIETSEALKHLEDIVTVSDGIMVARGDLGVEASLELIPYYQKRIIQLANQQGKPVITATQMLESMIVNDSPTRAEITDIANSILDGTDVMMLSGETAVGRHPVRTVQSMAAIAGTTEKTLYPFDRLGICTKPEGPQSEASAMARLMAQAAKEFKPKTIVVYTRTGYTASLIAAERPQATIHAFTPHESTYQRLALLWGVIPGKVPESQFTSRLVRGMTKTLLDDGTLQMEDLVLYLLGSCRSSDDNHSLRVSRAGAVMQETE
jgi:pyruvate kinase